MPIKSAGALCLAGIAVLVVGLKECSADYLITDLNTTPGVSLTVVNGINDSDQIVGEGFFPLQRPVFPFAALWQNGKITSLIGLASAMGINDAGQIVGGSLPFLWQNGSISILAPGGTATAINSSGQIVGTGPAPQHQAVLWQNGNMISLGPGFANSINSSGQIVGGTSLGLVLGRKLVGSPDSHAMLWQNGTATDLGPGYASAINASGLIAGTSNGHAVIWQNGTKIDLGPGMAEDVNDAGYVVGRLGSDPADSYAFVWHNGILTNLNDMIPPDSGWTLSEASGINNLGDIIGYGNRGVFLLTPVPETSTLLLLAVATLGIMSRACWRGGETGAQVRHRAVLPDGAFSAPGGWPSSASLGSTFR